MRSLASLFAASAVFASATLSVIPASGQSATEAPVVCAARSDAVPAKLIESCTTLIDNPATLDADRLEAMITRAVALHDSGQTDKDARRD